MTKKEKRVTIMKSLLVFILFNSIIFSSSDNLLSQSMPRARNSFYLSFGVFPGISIGINYERMISPYFSIKTGPQLVLLSSMAGINIPTTINYMTLGNNKFEFGLGLGPFFELDGKIKVHPFPAGIIGYRYQLTRESAFSRVGAEFPNVFSFGCGFHF